MKKLFFGFILAIVPLAVFSQIKRTIHVATAGTLSNFISEDEKYQIEELTLTGKLNGTDFLYIRDMAGVNAYINYNGDIYPGHKATNGILNTLNLSQADIVSGGSFYEHSGETGERYERLNFGIYYTNDNCVSKHLFSDTRIKSIILPNSVTSIEPEAFFNCSNLSSIKIESGNSYYDSRNDCNAIIEKSTNTLIVGCKNTIIPNSVTSIGENAFYKCSGLTSINIPNSVKSIDSRAFAVCSGLTSITIPNSVTSIGDESFYFCTSLASITIPNSVINIGGNAFINTIWEKKQQKGLVYAGKVVYRYFGEMPANTNITIEEGTLGIASRAFGGCIGLTSVTIPNSVTSIGQSTFYNCSGLTSVTIPNSVTSIGDYTFYGCSGLTSINIPNSVTSIGSSAFCGCSGLTSINIPNSVTSIGSSAFGGCSSLTAITIPSSVTSIDVSSFSRSSLTSIKVESDNQKYDSRNNCDAIIETSSNTLIIGCKNSTIPNSVTSIGNSAFYYCSGLTSVTIPNSVTSISQSAFYNCSGLTSITIPNSVTSIGGSAFSGCSSLTSIAIPNSVTSIGSSAFYNCSGLTSIAIPNSVTSIGSSAFQKCSNLFSVISEIENPFMIDFFVFWLIPSNATLIVPKGNKTAYQSTTGWSNFTNIVEAGEVGQVFILNGISYKMLENNTVSVVSGKNASGNVTIPNQVSLCGTTYSVTSISSEAFHNCENVIAITIPNSVTSIGSYAFSGCSSLVSVIIGSGVTSIGSSAFYNTNLKKTIWLTNTLPSGYDNALGAINYVSNDQFNISNKVVYKFLSSYFEVDGIRYVPVSPSDHTCDAIDCVYNESASISKIAPTVTYKGVTLAVQKIQPYICYNNKFINHLTMEVSGAISNNAFNGCSNMQTVILGSTNNDIDKDKITGIYIGSNITSIGDWVFSECESLNKLNIADRESELTLGSNGNSSMFSSCPLESVYIGGNITYSINSSKGYSPFYRNTAIRSVTITDKETEISQNEFYGCTSLQKVIIGDDVTTIGNRAFSSCSSLKYFAFGSQVANIGQNAFSDCTALIEISSKATTPPKCGSQALDDINKWECKLYVPDGCYDAYQNAEQWKEFFFTEEGEGTIVIDDEQAVLLGDANNDGEVDVYDIDAIVDYIMSGDINSINFKNADVNKDGKVNVADIVVLNKMLN